MIRILTLLLILLILQSCGSEKKSPLKERPEHVLTKDSLAFYLSQIHIIDAAMRHREVRKKNLQAQAKQGFQNYFDTAGVSKERFEESLNYWKYDYESMEDIYDESMEILSMKLVKLKQIESRDSLKTLKSKKR